MIQIINDIFTESKVFDGDYNYTRMFGNTGKFSLDREKMDEFLNAYSPDMNLGITEITQTDIPLYFDFDIKMSKDDYKNHHSLDEHFYSLDEVKTVIGIINDKIKIFVKDLKDSDLDCCLLELERNVSGALK